MNKMVQSSIPEKPVKRGVLSNIFHCWVIGYLFKNSTYFRSNQIPLNSEDDAQSLGNEICSLFQKHKSLKKVLWEIYGGALLFQTFLYILHTGLMKPCVPIAIAYMIKSFIGENDLVKPWVLATVLILFPVLIGMLTQYSHFSMSHIGIKCKVGLGSAIISKTLSLNLSAINKNGGKSWIISLLSNDLNMLDRGVDYFPYFIASPIQILFICTYLWIEVGPVSLTGLVLQVVMVPIQGRIGKRIGDIIRKRVVETDKRLKILTQAVNGVRTLKLSGLERFYEEMIRQLRSLEMKCLKQLCSEQGLSLGLLNSFMKISVLITVSTFYLTGYEMSAPIVFLILPLYNSISITIGTLPIAISALPGLLSTISRVQKFLLIETYKVNNEIRDKTDRERRTDVIKVQLKDVSWSYNSETKFLLKNISLNVKSNEFIGITGLAGVGKTTLLQILLGELQVHPNGKVLLDGKTAYVPQEPWLFPGTIQDNILMGQNLTTQNAQLYNQAIIASSLKTDLQDFVEGDLKYVGTTGDLLSGGQKARINLARALFSNADIYLFDDPLSAVDQKTAQHILSHLFKSDNSILKSKIVIMTTHQIHHLEDATRIYKIENNGELQETTHLNLTSAVITAQIRYDDLVEEIWEPIPQFRKNVLETPSPSYGTFKPKQQSQKIIENEEFKFDLKTFLRYQRGGNSLFHIWLVWFVCIMGQVALSGSDYFLKLWTVTTLAHKYDNNSKAGNVYLYVNLGLTFFVLLFCTLRPIMLMNSLVRASQVIHAKLLHLTLGAKIIFFELNSSGKILSIFSNDIGNLDSNFPMRFYAMIMILSQIIGLSALIIATSAHLLIPTIVQLGLLMYIIKIYTKSSFYIQNLELEARGPILRIANSIVDGLDVIKSFEFQNGVIQDYYNKQNRQTTFKYFSISMFHFFGLIAGFVANIYFAAIVSYYLIFPDGPSFGLAAASCDGIFGFTIFLILNTGNAINLSASINRIYEFFKLAKPEDDFCNSKSNIPPKFWPQSGSIKIENLSLSYTPETRVLNNINIQINGGEKIGIIGKSGTGKSTLISTLCRLYDLDCGTVHIDNVNLEYVDIRELRHKISFISQMPMIFSGTLRENIDPFNRFSDSEIWAIVGEVKLNDRISINGQEGLYQEVSEAASNFSCGEKQLISLARTLLENNRIVILDEATSSVDKEADYLIQNLLAQKHGSSTILKIAHRLNSVMDCDRVLVLDQGAVREFDTPLCLLENPHSFLSRLVDKCGQVYRDELMQIIKKIH